MPYPGHIHGGFFLSSGVWSAGPSLYALETLRSGFQMGRHAGFWMSRSSLRVCPVQVVCWISKYSHRAPFRPLVSWAFPICPIETIWWGGFVCRFIDVFGEALHKFRSLPHPYIRPPFPTCWSCRVMEA